MSSSNRPYGFTWVQNSGHTAADRGGDRAFRRGGRGGRWACGAPGAVSPGVPDPAAKGDRGSDRHVPHPHRGGRPALSKHFHISADRDTARPRTDSTPGCGVPCK